MEPAGTRNYSSANGAHSVARGFTSARQTLALMLAALVASAVGLEHAASAQATSFGTDRLEIQARLGHLGYLPADAVSGVGYERTREAMVAFQGWEGLERDGKASPATLARLATASRPAPLPGSGTRIEVHLNRQVVLLVKGHRVERAIHVSTGAVATPTPKGKFHVYRKERRSWSVPFSVWLPWASYFNSGIAFHGYAEVPAYQASHGCVRVPLGEAPTVYAFARLGVPIRVVS
jgi:lipoprotein-anchoring transpeptidase ErfK/SrfK